MTCLGLFRLLMKGIFGPYVLWPLDKRLIFWLVTRIRTRDYTVRSLSFCFCKAKNHFVTELLGTLVIVSCHLSLRLSGRIGEWAGSCRPFFVIITHQPVISFQDLYVQPFQICSSFFLCVCLHLWHLSNLLWTTNENNLPYLADCRMKVSPLFLICTSLIFSSLCFTKLPCRSHG